MGNLKESRMELPHETLKLTADYKEAQVNLFNTEEEAEKSDLLTNGKVNVIIGSTNGAVRKRSEGEKETSEPKTGWRKYGGIIFGLAASVFFSLSIVIVKVLKDYHPFSIAVWRFLGILLPSILIVLYYTFIKNKDDKGKIYRTVFPLSNRERRSDFIALMLRGFLGCTMVLFRFYALQYLSVADVSVISYSGPVFVTILAHFFLKEKCGVVPILVAIVTFFGVFVIVRPPMLTGGSSFDTDTLIGSGLALISMICNAIVIIVVRKTRKVNFAFALLLAGIWGVAESLILAVSFGVMEFPRGMRDSLLTLGALPTLVFLAQYSIILALKFENAGPVSLIRTLDVIFAFVWQFIFLSVYPDIFSLIGASIVIFGVVVISTRKWLSTLPPENGMRKKLNFLLY